LMVHLTVTHAVMYCANSGLVHIHAWSVALQLDCAIPARVQLS
jgi:hypothetical protein